MKFAFTIPFTNIVIANVNYMLAFGAETHQCAYIVGFNDGVEKACAATPEKRATIVAQLSRRLPK